MSFFVSRRWIPALLVAPMMLLTPLALRAQASYTSMPLDQGFGPLDQTQPEIPVQQIITEFTAKEAVFRQALNNYTWQRSVRVQTVDDDGKADGQYYQVVDIAFDDDGPPHRARAGRAGQHPHPRHDVARRLFRH